MQEAKKGRQAFNASQKQKETVHHKNGWTDWIGNSSSILLKRGATMLAPIKSRVDSCRCIDDDDQWLIHHYKEIDAV